MGQHKVADLRQDLLAPATTVENAIMADALLQVVGGFSIGSLETI